MMNKKIILTFLPLKTDFEKIFWNRFVDECLKRNYKVIHYGNKSLNNNAVTEIFVHRNLEEYYLYNSEKIQNGLENKESLIGETVLKDCLNRELACGQANATKKAEMFDVLRFFEQLIIRECKENEILSIVTWTQLTPMSYIARKVGHKLGLPVFEAERAPLNNFIWIESNGIFGEAALWKKRITYNRENLRIGARIRKDLCKNVYGFREGRHNSLDFEYDKENLKLFFLPMDNIYEAGWLPTEFSVAKKRYKDFLEPLSFIKKINTWVKNNNGILVVKWHPSCIYFDKERRYDFIVSNADLKELLRIADYVICNYTKVAFPALAMGKKLILLSKNIALCSGECFYAESVDEINISEVNNIRKDYYQKIDNFFGWLAREYFFTCNNKDCNDVSNFVSQL